MKATIEPDQYVRKPDVLKEAGYYIGNFRKKAAVIRGKKSLKIIENTLRQSLTEQGLSLECSLWYEGEASQTNIKSLVEEIPAEQLTFSLEWGR